MKDHEAVEKALREQAEIIRDSMGAESVAIVVSYLDPVDEDIQHFKWAHRGSVGSTLACMDVFEDHLEGRMCMPGGLTASGESVVESDTEDDEEV